MRYYDSEEKEYIREDRLFSRLAAKIFKPDLWSDREVKLLKKLGLHTWFGLTETIDDDDFFEDFPFRTTSRKDDWLG